MKRGASASAAKRPTEKSLLEALKQNWEHARHVETQRQQQFYVFIVLFGAVTTILNSQKDISLLTLSNFWPVFLFLAIILLLMSRNITKWNIEFGNHIRAIQWIAEKLALIQPLSNERKKQIEESKYSEEEKIKLKKDAMFQGYIGLPLPLPIRVHRVFDYLFHFLLGAMLFLFFICLWICSFEYFSTSLHLCIPQYRDLFYAIGFLGGATFGISISFYNLTKMNEAYSYAEKLKCIRTPEEIKLKYEDKPYFWETQ
ncbi:MAG: hypothetical protein QW270_05195 [Candidatus Bathyarchaeia archaeon]